MRQRLQIICCLFAWFIATGCQWDLAQLVAWGRMFAGYSQAMSLGAAARKTFSGEMCGLCKVVQAGKQEQEQSASKPLPGKGDVKLLDACPVTAMAKVPPPIRRIVGLVASTPGSAGRERMPPPLPPPRVAA